MLGRRPRRPRRRRRRSPALAPWAPFALAAVARPAARAADDPSRDAEPEGTRGRRPPPPTRARRLLPPRGLRPGVRGFLLAQILWVLGYAALPAFFLLYAEEELGLGAGRRLALARRLRARHRDAAIVAAGRVKNPALHRPLLLVGIVLLGGGFLGVAASTSLRPRRRGPGRGRRGLRTRLDPRLPALLVADPRGRGGAATPRCTSRCARSPRRSRCPPPAGPSRRPAATARSSSSAASLRWRRSCRSSGSGVRASSTAAAQRSACSRSVPVLGLLVAHTERAPRRRMGSTARSTASAPGPELLWKAARPAHAQLPPPDRARRRRRRGDQRPRRAARLRARLRLGAPRVGPARGRVRGLRPRAPGGSRRRDAVLNGHSGRT